VNADKAPNGWPTNPCSPSTRGGITHYYDYGAQQCRCGESDRASIRDFAVVLTEPDDCASSSVAGEQTE
jgi:hypothetical protein